MHADSALEFYRSVSSFYDHCFRVARGSCVIRGIISSNILQLCRVFCDVRHTKLNAFPVRHDKAKSRLLVTHIREAFCKLKDGKVGQLINALRKN